MQASLFGLLSAKSAWLGQRQAVLARNIANADTPRFQPQDLVPFATALKDAASRLAPPGMMLTDKAHLAAAPAEPQGARASRVASYEIAPAGNAVVLEEEMQKLGATKLEHDLATGLYRKYAGLMRQAIGMAAA
mgnify:CR=1 FL=1